MGTSNPAPPSRSDADLARVRIVLVRPAGGANVGAVCRAIENLGGGRLVLVDAEFDPVQARRMAVHAADLLDTAIRVDTLTEALEGCSLVVGTTARTGTYRARVADIAAVAGDIAVAEWEARQSGLVPALVFGAEASGLTNCEIALCHRLATIDTEPIYPSLNLAQAVLICLYEVRRARRLAAQETPEVARRHPRADAAAVEAMLVHLEEAIVACGFASEQTRAHIMMTFRDVLGRAGLDEREVRVFRGLARQVSWLADGGDRVLAAKRAQGKKPR